MIKEANVDSDRKESKGNPRGWEALKIMLQERGITGRELEEAQVSFCKGIEILSKLFLFYYLPEKKQKR